MLPTRLRRAAWALTEPSPRVAHAHQRRQARLLAAVLLAAVPLAFATVLLTALTQGATPATAMGAATSLAGLGAYALSRSRRPEAGGAACVLLAAWGAWSAALAPGSARPNDPALFFLALSVLLGGLLLPVRATLAVAAGNVAGVLALPWLTPGLAVGDVLDPALFLVFASALIAVFSAVRRRDVQHIEAQARAIAAQEARLRAILDHAPDIIMLVDRAARIRYVNRTVPGLSPERVLGTPLTDHVPDGERARLLGLVQQVFASGRGESCEMRGFGRAGPETPYASRLAPVVQDGEVVALILIVTDVTDRKAAEEERVRSHERAAAIARLEEEARFRANFINLAAHELRTPMAPIKTQLYLLRRRRAPHYAEEERAAFDVLERNVERLHALLRDLLDAARIQAGRMELQVAPVDLAQVARQGVGALRAQAERGGVRLELRAPGPLVVRGDGTRLGQVVATLLGNAVRFTPPGGEVLVEARAEGARAVLRVRHTGEGLTEEQRSVLFQPFGQLRVRADRVAEGTGLCLSIARDLVERHGGEVRCESGGPGHGCTFVVELPLRAVPLPA